VKPFSPVEARTEIPAPVEQVWATVSDPETYPDWLVGAQRMRSVDSDFPAPGSEFHHSVGPSEAATVDDKSEATGADPPHRLDLRVHVGPLTAEVELLVLPTPTGSEVRFLERPAGMAKVLTPAIRPILHARNVESLRRLRNRFERSAALGS
jgi:uncharacterized protein YndB with AHSA1/START domain